MRRKWFASVLLCVLLLSACTSAGPDRQASGEKKENVVQRIEWSPVYNDHQCGVMINKTLPAGVSQKTLSQQEIVALVPPELLASMKTVGYVYFQNGKDVYRVVLQMRLQEGFATVCLGSDASDGACCSSVALDTTGKTSACGAVEYVLYRQLEPQGMSMVAKGEVNGIPILVRIDSEEPSRDKVVFERILESFSRVKNDSLCFSEIKP